MFAPFPAVIMIVVVFGASKDAKMKRDLHKRGKSNVGHAISIIFLSNNELNCTKEAAAGW
jgi:hypothetical protein